MGCKGKKKNLFILCLSKHGSSCLLQDALFRESCHLICHISITDTGFSGLQVLRCVVIDFDSVLKTVLNQCHLQVIFIHVLIKFYAVLEECMPVEENLQKILMMLEEKKSLWRRLVEWAFPNFKINKKEYTVDSSRYVRYQDVTEPEKILQPDDFD